jgi:hypothetical protein
MKYSLFAASVFCILIVVSCGENEGGGARVETAKIPQVSVPSTPSNNPVLPGNNAAPAAPIIPGGKLNPAHGQPGHRCDIAVGAPLPATTAAPVLHNPAITPVQNSSTTINPTTAVQPQPAAATTVAKGINPPHGQPGHRCDIAVGQPLTSAPAKPTTTTTTPAPVVKPVVDNTPDTLFAKGLNPAHGKPGHRCDIAVGQPLTSAAKKDTATSKTN